ncbi:MAG: EAL domain-containing protein [Legionellaceae bacterium]|nr:EAL domain-containing protein [Legionellaceae bacterium]
MAKYLITGGCGFIGSQLTCKLIETGHDVIVIDNLSNGKIIHPKAKFVKQDITQFDAMYELFANIDGCFHLAAIPTVSIEIENWFNTHAINLEASLNVFKAAIDAGNVPVVYASSCGVYGNATNLPLNEDQLVKPLCSYGCDKISTELNAYFLAHEYQLPSMGLRFFNVYGPYQPENSPYSGVITRFITNLLEDKPITIFGDGKQTRDFVFVEDVVDNLIHAMKILKHGAHVVNICTGHKTSINRLITLLTQNLNRDCTKEYLPARPFDAKHSYGSLEKMKKYGFTVKNNIEQGLIKTIDYFLLSKSLSIHPLSIENQSSETPWLGIYDGLTGFANLALVRDKIQSFIQAPCAHQIALLILNIDDFRLVNDLLGVRIGDLLLCSVVEKVSINCLVSDVFARKCGDEFILVFFNHSIDDIEKITQKILELLSMPFLIEGHEIYITVSIGISLWPEDAKHADELLACANLALNRVKESGKDNYQYYKKEIASEVRSPQQIKHHLMRALQNNELDINYQPQIETNSQRIVGCEALLRWNSPQMGVIAPVDFIPIAEKTGQIIPIGDWLLQKACLEAVEWQKLHKKMFLSINVSLSQLRDHRGYSQNHFIDSVERALNHASLKPELLELEITESILMQMNDQTLARIKKLKKLGVHIACDDFGIGYSSYKRMLQLPLDTIKIDQSLIMEISKKKINSEAIIGGVIALAHQLNIKIVAEGVETKAQFDVLKNLGCDVIQGNYFSKPVLPEVIARLLKLQRE